jgi:hypothetical protein
VVSDRAALGFRCRTGWATVVGVAGSRSSPAAVLRRRVELLPEALPRQVFHAARELEAAEAERLIRRTEGAAQQAAEAAVRSAAAELESGGGDVVGMGLVLGGRRPPQSLASILASHSLLHAAEGELYREVVAGAAESCGLALTGLREREVFEVGAPLIGFSSDDLRERVTRMGQSLGAPWGRDQKLAAAVAWAALVGRRE